jgi:hypothetical protein
MLCTVMYCRELADGIYNVGASFSRTYDFQALPPAAPPPSPLQCANELDRIRQSILG